MAGFFVCFFFFVSIPYNFLILRARKKKGEERQWTGADRTDSDKSCDDWLFQRFGFKQPSLHDTKNEKCRDPRATGRSPAGLSCREVGWVGSCVEKLSSRAGAMDFRGLTIIRWVKLWTVETTGFLTKFLVPGLYLFHGEKKLSFFPLSLHAWCSKELPEVWGGGKERKKKIFFCAPPMQWRRRGRSHLKRSFTFSVSFYLLSLCKHWAFTHFIPGPKKGVPCALRLYGKIVK